MIYAILSVVLAGLAMGLLHYIKKSGKLEQENEVLRTQAEKLKDQLAIAAAPPSSPSELLDRMHSNDL